VSAGATTRRTSGSCARRSIFPTARSSTSEIRRVGALPNPSVPAYTAADIRIAWRLQRELELSVVFIDSGHVEFGNPATASEMSSGAYVKLKWNY